MASPSREPVALDQKIQHLRALLSALGDAVVCFSAGVDSAYLLAEAKGVLGPKVAALTAVSPSMPAEEAAAARRIAASLEVRHLVVETHEVEDPRYAANPPDRCYFCKNTLFESAAREAESLGFGHVLDGFNADDRGDHRPGRRAAQERGVRSLLDEAGFTKADVREAARRLGLETWRKPAAACLASRFPYGTAIDPERLGRVERCEAVLAGLGFEGFRVRYHDTVARIEVPPDQLPRLVTPEVRSEVVRRFKEAGFTYVAVDLEGYRTGALNEVLVERS